MQASGVASLITITRHRVESGDWFSRLSMHALVASKPAKTGTMTVAGSPDTAWPYCVPPESFAPTPPKLVGALPNPFPDVQVDTSVSPSNETVTSCMRSDGGIGKAKFAAFPVAPASGWEGSGPSVDVTALHSSVIATWTVPLRCQAAIPEL